MKFINDCVDNLKHKICKVLPNLHFASGILHFLIFLKDSTPPCLLLIRSQNFDFRKCLMIRPIALHCQHEPDKTIILLDINIIVLKHRVKLLKCVICYDK